MKYTETHFILKGGKISYSIIFVIFVYLFVSYMDSNKEFFYILLGF